MIVDVYSAAFHMAFSEMLNDVKNGRITIEQAMQRLENLTKSTEDNIPVKVYHTGTGGWLTSK